MNVDQIYGVRKLGTAKWLAAQMNPYVKVPDTAMDHLATRYPRLKWEIWQVRDRLDNGAWDVMDDLVDMHIARAAWSRRQLLEVMVDFWSNHFNITCPSSNVWDSRARFDHDVIRTNAFGRFEDMLIASAKHPAMLNYLNNAISTYKEPNENYGREVLELHTVGIGAGYTETDMHNSALIFTGMSIDGRGRRLPLQELQPRRRARARCMGFQTATAIGQRRRAVGDALPEVPRAPPGHGLPPVRQAGHPLRLRRSAAHAGQAARAHLRDVRHGDQAGAAGACSPRRSSSTRPARRSVPRSRT